VTVGQPAAFAEVSRGVSVGVRQPCVSGAF
jgi:hypothetical protein